MTTYYRTPIELVGYNDEFVSCVLSNKMWFIRMTWNEASQKWFFAINDYEDHTLIRNIPIIANEIVGVDYLSYDGLPDGVFYVESVRGTDEVLRNDFQTNIATLYYYYEEEDNG